MHYYFLGGYDMDHLLYRQGKGLREMEKPEKIYLNNPNQIHALQVSVVLIAGTGRRCRRQLINLIVKKTG